MKFFSIFKKFLETFKTVLKTESVASQTSDPKFKFPDDFKKIGATFRKNYKDHLLLKHQKKYKKHFKKCQCINLLIEFNNDLSQILKRSYESKDKKAFVKIEIINELILLEEILMNYDFIHQYGIKRDDFDQEIKSVLAEILYRFSSFEIIYKDPMKNIFYMALRILNQVFNEIYDIFNLEETFGPKEINDKTRQRVQYNIDLFTSCFEKLSIWLEANSKKESVKTILLSCQSFRRLDPEVYNYCIYRYKIKNDEKLKKILSEVDLIDLKSLPERANPNDYKKGGIFFIKNLNNEFLKYVKLQEKEIHIENTIKRSPIIVKVPGDYFETLPANLRVKTNINLLECLDIHFLLLNLKSRKKPKHIHVDFDELDRNEPFDNLLIVFFLLIYAKQQEQACFYDSISKTNSQYFDRLHKLIFSFQNGKNIEIHFDFPRAVYVQKNNENYSFYVKKKEISEGEHGKIYLLNSTYIEVWKQQIEVWNQQIKENENYFSIGFEFKKDSRVLKSMLKSEKCVYDNEEKYDLFWKIAKNQGIVALLQYLQKEKYHDLMKDLKEFLYYLFAMINSQIYFEENSFPIRYNKRGKSNHYFMPKIVGKNLRCEFKKSCQESKNTFNDDIVLDRLSKIEFLYFTKSFVKSVKKFLINFDSYNDLAPRNSLVTKKTQTIGNRKFNFFEVFLIDTDHAVVKGLDSSTYKYYFNEFLSEKAPKYNYYLFDLFIQSSNRELPAIVRAIVKGLNMKKYKEKIESFEMNLDVDHFESSVNEVHKRFNDMIKEDKYLENIPELKKLFLAMHDRDHAKRPSFSDILITLDKMLENEFREEIERQKTSYVQNSP